jgi:tRNA 5-methylaminomethyl-2-thiouridine biosynthesis bifunctional protein
VESTPSRLADLEQVHRRWPELARWRRNSTRNGRCRCPACTGWIWATSMLTLGFGDACRAAAAALTLAADAIYLDGFAPDRNPELWSDPVVAQLRRLAAPGATLATWTTAGEVRRRLAGADFSIERRPGFGGKREMLAAACRAAHRPTQLGPAPHSP